MADVQIDNGEFTRIANILLEQTAKLHLNGTQYSIVLTVWRFTYGFQRCEHDLSITFISKATGISTRAIKKELKYLIDRNIILVSKESTKAESRVLKFNKDYESWVQGNNQSPGEQPIPSQGNNQSPQQGNKTTPKKEIKKTKESIVDFFEKAWSVYPNKVGKGKIKDAKKKEIHKLGDEFERCISRYIKSVEERRRNGFKELNFQNGSTFFSSGYVDYLDVNYQVDKPLQKSSVVIVEGDYLV